MIKVLLPYAAKSTAISVAVMFLFCFFVLGEGDAIGALLAGALAGGNFLAWIYLVGRILDPRTPPKSKMRLMILMVTKLAIVGLILWLVLETAPVTSLGLILGLGAAIGGFTVGLNQATSSEAGRRAIEEEERRLREEMGDEDADFE